MFNPGQILTWWIWQRQVKTVTENLQEGKYQKKDSRVIVKLYLHSWHDSLLGLLDLCCTLGFKLEIRVWSKTKKHIYIFMKYVNQFPQLFSSSALFIIGFE